MKIWIIGAGNLGQSFATKFIELWHDIALSYSGNPQTLEKLKKLNLHKNISTNEHISKNCDIVFLTIKPKNISSLYHLNFNSNTLLVSCIAGIKLEYLQKHLHDTIIRIMPSSPKTITSNQAICWIFPENEILSELVSQIWISTFYIDKEKSLHEFTAGVCIPAALIALKHENKDTHITSITHSKLLNDILSWAKRTIPSDLSVDEEYEYIYDLCTKWWVTERIVSSIREGFNLEDSIQRGILRSQEIEDEYC